MEQSELVNSAARLINQASANCAAGQSEQSAERIEELRELLNLEHAERTAEAEKKDPIPDGGTPH